MVSQAKKLVSLCCACGRRANCLGVYRPPKNGKPECAVLRWACHLSGKDDKLQVCVKVAGLRSHVDKKLLDAEPRLAPGDAQRT